MRTAASLLVFLLVGCADPAPPVDGGHQAEADQAFSDRRWLEALTSDSVEARREAALALGQVGRRTEAEAIPALQKALADPDAFVRLHAAAALGTIGPRAAATVPSLVERLADRDPMVADGAAKALGRLGAKASAALSKALDPQESPEDVRVLAAFALGGLGADGVSPLLRGLNDRSAAVRRTTARALGKSGGLAASAVKPLERLAEQDPDPRVRQAAAAAVRSIRGF